MTDNDIIKALECCCASGKCSECPFDTGSVSCIKKTMSHSLNLIKRQKAEIERLNSCVKSEDEIRAIMEDQMLPMVCEIVDEQIDAAFKLGREEFAERLKVKGKKRVSDQYGERIFIKDIDNLLEEMEREDE